MVALFDVGSSAEDISQAVTTLLASPNSVPSLSVRTVNINGRSYSNGDVGLSSNQETAISGSNIGLIVGLVIGIVVVLFIVAGIMAQRLYKKKFSRQQMTVAPSIDIGLDQIGRSNVTLPRGSMDSIDACVDETLPPPAWTLATPDLERKNPVMSPRHSRNPSVDISVHLSRHDDLDERPLPPPPPSRKLPPLKLIDFE